MPVRGVWVHSELNRNVTRRHRKKSSPLCIGKSKNNDANTQGSRANTLFSFPEQFKAQNSFQYPIGEIFILRKEEIIFLWENGNNLSFLCFKNKEK